MVDCAALAVKEGVFYGEGRNGAIDVLLG